MVMPRDCDTRVYDGVIEVAALQANNINKNSSCPKAGSYV